MKIKFGLLIFCVVFTFFIGSFFAFFVNTNLYENLNLLIKVPSFVFPIVWSIIYLLLGISFYLILISNNSAKEKALKYFLIQLFINSIWTLFFFGFSLYILSFILIILLIILVVLMIINIQFQISFQAYQHFTSIIITYTKTFTAGKFLYF